MLLKIVTPCLASKQPCQNKEHSSSDKLKGMLGCQMHPLTWQHIKPLWMCCGPIMTSPAYACSHLQPGACVYGRHGSITNRMLKTMKVCQAPLATARVTPTSRLQSLTAVDKFSSGSVPHYFWPSPLALSGIVLDNTCPNDAQPQLCGFIKLL